jgi:hypothetical protein
VDILGMMAMNIDNKLSVANPLDGNFSMAFLIGYFLGKGNRIGTSIFTINNRTIQSSSNVVRV